MRKQILALLSALGLVGPAAPAPAQGLKDGTSNTIKAESGVKRAKAAREDKASELSRQHKANKASATKQGRSFGASNPADIGRALKTRKIPPGPNSINLKAGRADFTKFHSGPAKTLTLNPQPLPPGVHSANPQPTPPGIHPTMNPQPLPPGAHTLNPQPLPPGVHTSNARMTSSPNKTAIGSGTSGAGAGKDTLGNTSSAASRKVNKSAQKPQ